MNLSKLFKAGFRLTAIASFFFWHVATALPQNGQVTQGAANISQSPNQVVITQTSQNTVINWQNFNTASNEAVLFSQPNSSAIALNRITSGTPTSFAGSLSANGQVWIINPAGVLFTSTSKIDVAGLLVTTHNISDNNFMSGNYQFSLDSNFYNSQIINNGSITIKDTGYAALVAPGVENNGMITANLGKVYLASGSSYVVDLYGDQLINFGISAPVPNGSVSNSGVITATGGKVSLTANSAAQVVNNVVSMSGVIEATTATTGRHGEIILNGGQAGVTHVSGKIHAPKGHVETSGHVLIIDDSAVIDASGGSWLIDPWNITIVSSAGTCTNIGCTQPFTPTGTNSQIGANLIVAQLNGGTDVTLYTGGANGGTDAGTITVNAAITANSGSGSLTLQADYQVIINQPININGNFFAAAALTTPSGNIQLHANVTTVGSQEYGAPVVLTVSPVTLTATGATNSDIAFDSTITGPGALTVTTPGNIFFGDVVGQGTALTSLATTSGADPSVATFIAGNVTTTGTQTYTNTVNLGPSTPPITLQGSTIEIKNDLVSGSLSDLTIQGNLLMDLNSNLGGIGSNVRSLTVTGSSTIGGAINTSTGNETFTGPVTVNGSAVFDTNTSGNIIFQSTIEGPGSASIFSAGSIVFNNTVGLSTALASLSAIASSIDIKNASNTTSFTTTGTQDIQASTGGILLDTLNSITFNAPGQTIDFVGPMDSYSTTTPLQTNVVINGNLFYVEGINNTPSGIGQKFNLSNYTSVNSLDVKGTSILGANVNSVLQNVNIRTLNNQTYEQGVQLGGTNQNVTSVNGNITFQGTLDGNVFNTQNFTVNAAAGNAEFDGVVGSVAHNLVSLSVTANNINFSSASVTTAGNQAYMVKAGMYINNTITFNAGTITFDGTSNPSNNTAIYSAVVSQGPPLVSKAITINGNTVFNDMSGNGTAQVGGVPTYSFANDWMFNGTTTFMGPVGEVIDAQQTITFVGAVILGTDTSLGIGGGSKIWFQNTVQSSGGPFSLLLAASAGVVEFDGQVGASSTSASASNLNNLTVVAAETDFKTSGIVDTNGDQDYVGAVKLFTDTVLTSINTGITFTDTYASRFIATSTVDSDSAVIANARALTLVSPLTVTLRGNIGSINKLQTLTIGSNVVATPTSISTASISTVGSQTYWGTVALTPAAVTLTETTGVSTPILFKKSVTGLSTALTVADSMTVSPAASLTLKSITVSGTTIGPNTTTTNGQTWGVLVLNTDETFHDTSANGINFTSTVDGAFNAVVNEDGASGVTFGGAVGNGTALNSLTVSGTNGIAINGGIITTTNNQIFNNAVTLGASDVLTSSAGNININSTVAGGGNALTISNFGSTSSVSGIISNLANLTKAGAGTLTIPAANTYSGNTIITGGILSIAADNNLGTAPGSVTANSIQISNGGTLQFTTLSSFVLNSNRGITLNSGGGTLQVASGVTLTYNGIFSGANALTLSGPGGITLGSNITAPSAITVIANVSPFTFGGTVITATAGSLTINPVTIFTTASAISLTATGASSDLTFGGTTLTLANTLNMTAGRNIYLNGNISDVGGTLNLTAAYSGAAVTSPATSSTINSGSFGSPSATGVTANITVANFNLLQGVWFQKNASLPQFNISNSFTLSSDRYVTQGAGLTASYMRVLGGDGSSLATAYQLTDVYGLQGINASDGSTLLTKFYTLANNIDATGVRTWNNGLGFHPIGFWNTFYTGFVFQGNFNGNGNVINGLYVNRSQAESVLEGEMGSALFAVTGAGANIHDIGLTNVDITSLNDRAAGLVAFATYQSNTTISNVFVTGKVTTYGGCCTGGVVGYSGASFLSTLYNNATITANGGSEVGGVVGYLLNSSLANSYNVGKIYAVGTVSDVGGLVGADVAGSVITNTYNSGPVNNAFGTAGGLVGFYNASGGITNSYYDTQTSLTASAFGSGSTTGVTGLTTAQMMQPSNFSTWTIADGSGSPGSNVFSGATPPPAGSFFWVILTGNTRPMLTMEWSTSIKTPHQVQLMAVAKAASYSLAYNIDFYDALTSASDVWGTNYNFPSGSGFFPVGGGSSTTAFTGNFNGNNLIINNLYINRPATNYVGLFGANNGNGTTIQNVGLTNVNITGNTRVGGLIGQNSNGGASFPNVFVGGTGQNQGNTTTTINNVFVTGSVNGGTTANTFTLTGGLIGLNSLGNITNSYSTANVTGVSAIGGFTGDNYGNISQSFATGNVTNVAQGLWIGGFTGATVYGLVTQTYSSGTVTAAASSSEIGGFVGELDGASGGFSNTISNSYSVSNIIVNATNTRVGGFIGDSETTSFNGGTPVVTTSYSSGNIPVTGATIGGFLGTFSHSLTMTNNFWDTQSSGQATSTGSGATGKTTAQMETLATFTGATWSMTNLPSATSTAPAFTWFIFPNQTRPLLMMENNPNVGTPHAVQMMGAALGGNYTLVRNIDFTNMFNNKSEVWATNRNIPTGQGFVPVGDLIANFIGTINGNGQIINALYINRTVTSGSVGLFGVANGATLRNLSVTNASISQSVSANPSGIIAGALNGSSLLTTSYASGSINNTGDTGGLVGELTNTSSLQNDYNLASVVSNTSGFAGGVVGNMHLGSPSVINTYSTNTVNATTTPGGVIGHFAGTLTNNFWDTQTSNISSTTQGCGNVSSCSGVTGITTAQTETFSTFSSVWSITATPSTSAYAPNFTWFIVNEPNGNTRPMLMIENNPNIVNTHQLQMMEAALGNTYFLLNNLDFNGGGLTDIHDVWATNYNTPSGTGFVPVGAGSATTAFQGFFQGNNYVINNLYINQPTIDFIGLFGASIGNGATINNIGLTNVNITGHQAVGGVVGQNSNSGAAGFTGGTTINQTGNTYSNIFKVYVTGAVNATSSFEGGVIGFNSFGNVGYSYETASVNESTASGAIGGFVGENMGVITASYAAGAVTTQVSGAGSVGGFAGVNFYGQINQSYSTGSVTAANGSTNVGGFVGLASSSVVTNATNLITNSYSFSNVVTSNSTNVGGFVGSMAVGSGNVPTISTSYSMGAIIGSGNTNQGGFGGNYAPTAVTTNNFWDADRSGVATDSRATPKTTIQMMTPSTFSTWNTTTIWNLTTGHTYPYLRVFYSTPVQAISGFATAATPNSLITIAVNGVNINTTPTGANEFFYELNGLNNISGIDTSLTNGGILLAYQSGSTTVGDDVAVLPAANASLSGIYDASLNPVGNGLILSLNTVTAGNTGTTSLGLSNAQLATGKGALSDAGILYSVSSNNLTNIINKSFVSTSATTYTVDGNITVSGTGLINMNGPVIVSAASPIITTDTAGSVRFGSTVIGSAVGKSLTVTSGASGAPGSVEFDNVIGSNAIPFTNFTLTGNTTYLSAVGPTVFVSGAETYNNGLVLTNIPTLSLNGTSVTLGGAMTDVTAATSLTIPGNLIINSSGSIGQTGVVFNSLTVTGTTNNGGNITTTNNQLYNGAYTLTGSHVLTSNAGNVTFNSTVNGGFNFTVNGGGQAVFTGAVGNTAALGALSVTFNNPSALSVVTFNSTLDVSGAVTISDTSQVNSAAITFGGAVGSLTPLGSLSATTNAAQQTAINVNSTLNVTGGVTISGTAAGSGYSRIGFSGAIGNLTPPSSLSVTSNSFAGTQDAQISFSAPVTVNGTVTLSDTGSSGGANTLITFTGAPLKVLSGNFNATLNSAGIADLRFFTTSSIDVAGAININNAGVTGTSTVLFTSDIGDQIAPTSLTISGNFSTGFNASNNPTFSITTVNNQAYNMPVTLFGNSSLVSSSGNITFGSTINGAKALTTSAASGATNFNGIVGGSTLLTSLSVTGAADINTSLIHTTSNQHYFGPVVLGTDATLQLSGGTLTFDGAVSGAHNLIIDPPAIVQINADINTTSVNITATSAININTANIQTSADQIYNGPVVLQFSSGSTLTSTAGNINFISTIDGGGFNLTVNNFGATSSAADVISNLASLTKAGVGTFTLLGANTYGTTIISAGTLQIGNGGTAGTLGSGAVTDNGNLTFNHSDTITVPNTISGAGSLTQLGVGGTTILTANNNYTGGTTITNGTLQIGNGGATGAITGAIVDNAALIFNTSNSFTLGSTISGSGTVTQNGTGTITFSGANTYTGTTTINNGILSVTNVQGLGTAGGGAITVNNGGTLSLNLGNHTLLNAKPLSLIGTGFGGIGALYEAGVSAGNGSFDTINNLITLTGNTTIGLSSLGDLLINNPGTINGSGFNLALQGGNTSTFSDIKSTLSLGTGSVTVTGGGYWLLEAANSYSGGSFILNGWLGSFNNPGNAFSTGAITLGDSAGGNNDAALIIRNNGTPFTYPNPIILAPNTTGFLVISTFADNAMTTTFSGGVTGNNSFSVFTNHASIQSASNVFFTTNPVNNVGTVTVDGFNTGAVTFSSPVGSNVTNLIEISSTSKTILTAANTYGTTTITTGTVQVGNGGTTGTLGTGVVTDNGSLIFDRTNSYTVPNTITGTGSLTQLGVGGTTILTANNNYTGGTTITNGTLQIGNGGATGAITGAIVDNANLIFNTSNSFTLANTISGSGTVTQNGTGTITFAGANTYTGTTTINNGILSVTNVQGLGTASGGAITVNNGGTLSLNLGNSTLLNASPMSLIGAGFGGIGALYEAGVSAGLNSYDTINNLITLTGSTTIGLSSLGDLRINNPGTITGLGFNLTLQGGNISTISDIVSTLSLGTGSVIVTGGGYWLLLAANSYSGGTFILYGWLGSFNSPGNAFGTGSITLGDSAGGNNFAALIITNNGTPFTYPNPIILAPNTTGYLDIATFATNAMTINFSGGVTGNNNFIEGSESTGGTFSSNITFTTNPVNNAGTFANYSTTTGTINFNSGIGPNVTSIIQNSNTQAVTVSGLLTVNPTATTVVNNGTALVTLSGGITGPGNLILNNNNTLNNGITVSSNNVDNTGTVTNSGTGTGSELISAVIDSNVTNVTQNSSTSMLTLTGTNTYGTTTITAGTLQLGNAGLTGTLGTGTVTDNGSLIFNRTNTYTVPNTITGTGSLTQLGVGGTTILTANNNYTGGTTITNGTLQIGNGGATGAITGSVVDNGALIFNTSNNFTIPGTISGTGTVTQNGLGAVTFSGANNYSGLTTINSGILIAANNSALGTNSTVVNSGGTLQIAGGMNIANPLSLNGLGALGTNGALDTRLTGTAIASGVITLTGNTAMGAGSSAVLDIATTINGTTNGGQSLTLNGAGSVIFGGAVGNGLNTALSTLTSHVSLTINGGIVKTTSDQHYFGLITLGQNAELTSPVGIIEIDQGVSGGGFNLTIDPATVILAGSYNNVGFFSVTATSEIDFDNITTNTAGGESFTAPEIVLQTGDSSLTDTSGAGIAFNGAIDNCGGALTCTGGAGPFNLSVTENGASSTTFSGSIGANTEIASLTVNGTSKFNKPTAQVVKTVAQQTYTNTVTLATDITMTSSENSGVLGNDVISFGFGAAGIVSDNPNTRSLTVVTNNMANGPSGAGISGTVNVRTFTMGGAGGGDISPISQDSFVGGSGTTGAWDNTFIQPGSTGKYCVNGICTGALTITATDTNKTYGSPFTPTLYSVVGLTGGDSITSITLTSPIGSLVTATVLGGPYAIIPSNATSSGISHNHYTSINYVNGSLTVDPAPLTIKANDVTKTYGQTTTFTGNEFSIVSPTQLFNTDSVTSVTLTSPGTLSTANVVGSPYLITPSAAVGSGLSNYAITYDTSGTITVNQAPLTITPTSIIKTYGGVIFSTTTTGFTPSGLQNGETVGQITLNSAGLVGTASVAGSAYSLTGSNATGGTFDANNYNITYAPGATITVNKAPLTITPTSIIKTYGDVIPSTTTTGFTPTGLQNSETVGQITLNSAGLAGNASVAGSAYSVTGSNATGGTFNANNYNIAYAPGATITVNKAPLTITALPQTKVVGDFLPLSTTSFMSTGLKNLETISTVDADSAGLATTAAPGVYPYISLSNPVGTLDTNNYTISYVFGGNVTVLASPAPEPINNPDVPPLQIINTPNSGPAPCLGASCDHLQIVMENYENVGMVSCLFGFAEVTDMVGNAKILMPGEMIHAGDSIVATEGSQVCVKDLYSNKVECHTGYHSQ